MKVLSSSFVLLIKYSLFLPFLTRGNGLISLVHPGFTSRWPKRSPAAIGSTWLLIPPLFDLSTFEFIAVLTTSLSVSYWSYLASAFAAINTTTYFLISRQLLIEPVHTVVI